MAPLGLAALSWLPLAAWSMCHTSRSGCEFRYTRWSDCDPCSGMASRLLNVTAAAHFGGPDCPVHRIKAKECRSLAKCAPTAPCANGQFDCQLPGGARQCVGSSLVCDGTADCANDRDEANCTKRDMSRAEAECAGLDGVPLSLGGGLGLTDGTPSGRVLDNARFEGLCRTVRHPDSAKAYRLPMNLASVEYRVRSSDELRVQSFDSLQQFSREKGGGNRFEAKEEVSVGGILRWLGFHVGESSSYTSTGAWNSIFTAMKDSNSLLFSVKARIEHLCSGEVAKGVCRESPALEVAQFTMRSSGLLLDPYMEAAVARLPAAFNAKSYFDFFHQYGLFYAHSGALGGVFEHNYIFEASTLKTASQTSETLSKCLKASVSAGLGFFGIGGKITATHCLDAFGTNRSAHQVTSLAQHKLVNIVGGTVESAGDLSGAALKANGTFQTTKFQEWVRGVARNPVPIRQTLRSICDLFAFAATNDTEKKQAACLAAAQLYVQPVSAALCQPCSNGGQPVKVGQQCECACPAGFVGERCAEEERDPAAQEAFTFVTGRQLSQSPLSRSRHTGSKPTYRTRFGNTKSSASTGLNSSPDRIKLVTTGNPPVATDPPHMAKLPVGDFDRNLKGRSGALFFVQSPTGFYRNSRGSRSGGFSIVQLNKNLETVATTPLNFSSIPACNDPSDVTTCHLVDFDVDVGGQFIVSICATKTSSALSFTALYALEKTSGTMVSSISDPCGLGSREVCPRILLTTTCGEERVVSCPLGSALASVKVFSEDGRAQDLTQLSLPGQITDLQHFDGQLWLRTESGSVAALDLRSWDTMLSLDSPPGNLSRLFLDFAGNLLLSRAQDGDTSKAGEAKYQFSIYSTETHKPLALVQLSQWDGCQSMAAHQGKAYTLCQARDATKGRAILVFDYLK